MKLKWISAVNLMSIGNQPVRVEFENFDKTLIVGKNGQGKSLLVEAISMLWFGKAYRKITKSEIVNSINGKGLVVEGEWESRNHTWKVKRGIKPDVLQVWKDGAEVDSSAAKRDFQKYIEEYALTFNYDSFKRVIALGTAGYKQFMDMTAQERRSFVEEILDIQVFSVMNKLNKDYIKQNKADIKSLTDARGILEHKITTNKSVLDKSKENQADQEQYIRSEFTTLKEKIIENEVKLSELIALRDELDALYDEEVDKKLQLATTKIHQLQGQHRSAVSSVDTKMKFFAQSPVCPTCDQVITEEHKQKCFEELESQKASSEETLASLYERLQQAETKKQYLDTTKSKITVCRSDTALVERELKTLRVSLSEKERKLDEWSKSSAENDEEIINQLRTWNTERKQLKASEETLTEEMRDRELLLTVLKDDGVKSKIVENYLPIINGKVNKYLKIMDANYGFTLDENFKESLKSRGRETMSFNNLSQGQRMRVDLALMFTWRDIVKMRTGSYTNVLIMDEIMDSAADEDGIIALRKIIDSFEDTNTIIISHSEKHNKAWFNRVLKVSMQGLFTHYDETINQTESENNLYE